VRQIAAGLLDFLTYGKTNVAAKAIIPCMLRVQRQGSRGHHFLHGVSWLFEPSRFATLLSIGRDWQSAGFDSDTVFVSNAGHTQSIPFARLRARTLRTGWVFSSIQIEVENAAPILLKGIGRSKARNAFAKLASSLDDAATEHLKRNAERILAITHQIADAVAGRRYIAHADALQLCEQVVPHLFILWTQPDVANDNILKIIRHLEAFHSNHESIRADANALFLANEPATCADFFRTVEKQPLSAMQMRAILTDEDSTLVLAGAGSGKTSVIVGKVAYMLHRALHESQEILALAFSRDAKSELETRVEKRVGRPVEASTFHALGLAIIGQCEGRRPDVSVLSTDPAKLRRFIMDHLEKMLDTPQLRARVVTWFLEYLVPYRSAEEFQTAQTYYDYLRSQSLRSLKGDLVKSREERTIADFLFTNGIDYKYEAPYEHDTATSERRQYKPDFKIGDRGIYIEHFAINREGRTPPFIDEAEYKASMAWKRELHQKYNTRLIETYSWQRSEGSLLPSLEKSLREAGVVFKPLSLEESREHLRKLGDVDRFSDLLGTFLRHARSNQREVADMRDRAHGRPDFARMCAFLDVFEPILKAYVDELTEAQEIDFEGMIVRAAGYAENGRYVSPYRAIIVDEFQDISIARARLIKGLLRQHPLNRLFAVGDDWQSIYRFAGSDISIMRNFDEWFGHSAQVALDRTFRFSRQLSDRAADFVSRNPFQLPKTVTSDKVQNGAPITIIARGKDTDDPLRVTLESITKRKPQQRVSVQLLGRYNFNKPRDVPGQNRDFPNLNIEFRTVHGSKGLESDFVVVLDLLGGRYGFPSEIADDPVLSLVLAEAETYPNAEERRLFYVALTRARVGVYLLTDTPQSSFLNELRGQPGVHEIPTW